MNIRVLFFVLVLLSPIFAFSSGSQGLENRALDSCPETGVCAIEYNYLSTQDLDPFLKREKPVNMEHPLWKRYRRAMSRFPSAADCLTRPSHNQKKPDLRQLDWSKMIDTAAIEVCMFRIFSSYGSPSKAKLWFEAQGFTNVIMETYEVRSELFTRVRTYNLPRETNKVYVSKNWLSSQLLKNLIHSEGFRAVWDSNGVLFGVSYDKTTT